MKQFSVTTIIALITIIFFCSLTEIVRAEDTPRFNLSMDRLEEGAELPDGWSKRGFSTVTTETDPNTPDNRYLKIQGTNRRGGGLVNYRIPVKYAGSRVILSGKVKTRLPRGSGAYLRIVFFKDGQRGDFKMSSAIRGSRDWHDVSVEMTTPQNADEFTVVGMLKGPGSVWFDDFRVTVAGDTIEEFTPEATGVFRPDFDNEFDEGSRIEHIPLTENSIAALELLGRVWGFVKYHHPHVATGKVNWDYELFRVLPRYLAAESVEEQSSILVEWINDLGEYETSIDSPATDDTYRLTPDLDWIDKVQSPGLIQQLKALQKAKRAGENFYVRFRKNTGNPDFHEEAYPQFSSPDIGFRLLSLYRYWNIIQYYFPYRNLTDKDWDLVLAEYIPRFVKAKDGLAYRQAAMELICEVQDTHAQVRGPDEVIGQFRGTRQGMLKLRFVEGKLVVSDYLDERSVDRDKVKIGDIVTAVNEVKVEDWIRDKGRFYCASNRPTYLKIIAENILRTNGDTVSLTCQRGAETYMSEVPCRVRSEYYKVVSQQNKQREPWKVLEGNIVYLYPASLSPEDVQPQQLAQRLLDKDSLVIDLRCYPSQFIVFSVGDLVVPEETEFVKISRPDPTFPGAFRFTSTRPVGGRAARTFQGKVAILVDERTQSQAEYTTMALRTAPQAKVFGSTTAGADGNISPFTLPGDIKTLISGLGIYTPEGKDTQRIGIVPDVRIEPTIAGIKSGRDEVLEAALEWIKEGDE